VKKHFSLTFSNTLESSKSINFGRIVESYLVGKAPTLYPRNQTNTFRDVDKKIDTHDNMQPESFVQSTHCIPVDIHKIHF